MNGDRRPGTASVPSRSAAALVPLSTPRRAPVRVATLAVVLALLAALFPARSVLAVNEITIGYGSGTPEGTYLNAQNIANNLIFTSIAIQADTAITIEDDIDLSTSPFGTPVFGLTLIAPTINIDKNVNMNLSGTITMLTTTVNLTGSITSGGTLMDPARIQSTATQVNVLSDAASIQQALDLSSDVAPVSVQVSSGQYAENLTIDNAALTLSGNAGAAEAGADPAAPRVLGTQAGGNVITVTADNVTIDGLHLDGTVAGGSLASSVTGIFASDVDGLTISQNTLEGFSGQSISTPGSTNLTLDANLTIPAPMTFTVNSTSDPGEGGCDEPECTLREAILAANANAGTDTINFNIPGPVHTIRPGPPYGGLHFVTESVVIDGTTDPDVPRIELDGTLAGGAAGLTIRGGGSTIKGLVINRFAEGIKLQGEGKLVQENYIGTD